MRHIFPLILFSIFYITALFAFKAEEQTATIAGFFGLFLASLIIFLLRKKAVEKEKGIRIPKVSPILIKITN